MQDNLEELLKIINEESEKTPVVIDEIADFIEKFEIVEDLTCKVSNTVIHYTYASLYGGKMSKIGFFRKFNKFFKQKRTGKQRSYAIKGKFDLSREGLIKAEYFEKGLK